MPYWQLVTRSFRIAWDHKYLWLIAVFSGESGGSFNYSSGQRSTGNTSPNFPALRDQVTSWLSGHVGLIVVAGIAWLVVAIAFFILAAVCEAATIRAAAEHDAERPFGLGMAWRMGVHRMWVMVRFRLLLLLLNLPLAALIVAWVIGLIVALVNENGSAIVALVFSGLLVLLIWFVYGTYLLFLDRIGSRVVILEELKATAAVARAHRLLFKRLGRVLLVWLLSIGVAIVVGIGLGIVVVPFVAIGTSAPIVFVALVPLFVVIAAFLAAQTSTYWTLAFRRLDIDYAPAYAYPVAPPPGTQP